MPRTYLLQFFAIILIGCQTPDKKFDSKTFDQVGFSEALKDSVLVSLDSRDTSRLLEILQNGDDQALLFVAQAASSLQASVLSNALFLKIESPYIEIRRSIYFALGQGKSSENAHQLYKFLLREDDSIARNMLFEAIGKTGDISSIHHLDTMNISNRDAIGFARAYYRFSLRNIVTDKCNDRMVRFLSPENSIEVRQVASNFLARLRGEDLMKHIEILTKSATGDSDPVVRMNIMTAFNKTNSLNVKQILLNTIVRKDEDYRVRVNAINTLNYYQYDEVAPFLVQLINDKKESLHIRLECADYFTNRLKKPEYNEMSRSLNVLKSDEPILESRVLRALLGYAKDSDIELISKYIEQRINETSVGLHRSMLVQALGAHVSNYEILPKYIFYDTEVVVNSAAMQAFFELSLKENFSNLKASGVSDEKSFKYFFTINFKNAILSGDPTLIGYGAKGFRNKDIDYTDALESTEFIELAKQGLELPRDVETLIELEKTQAFIKGENEVAIVPPQNNPIDLDKIGRQKHIQYAKIKTRKGNFSLKFNKVAAPGAVANFIDLSQKGFFDNLFFHRVENNFVVQGGCPRGDGWGSSAQSIRSEFGCTYFKTGSVGMASAGKDTESSQWFVTHYPASHLDGIYTNFADVTEGMDVVHRLAVGDSILSVELY